jgi:hypothetical protein
VERLFGDDAGRNASRGGAGQSVCAECLVEPIVDARKGQPVGADLTVGLARLPVGEWIGVQGDSHWASDGVAVGTATLFDQAGAFGTGMTTAVSNQAAQIDFTNDPFPLRIA